MKPMKRVVLVAILLAACSSETPVDKRGFAVPGCAVPDGLPDLTIKAAGPFLANRLPLDERVEGRMAFRIENVGECRATATIGLKPFLLAEDDEDGAGHNHSAEGRVLPTYTVPLDLAAGDSTVVEWAGQLPRLERRTWSISVIVDTVNALREADERNNTSTLASIGYLEVTHSQIAEETGYDFYTRINGGLLLMSGGVSHSLALAVRPYPSTTIASTDVWARFMLADLDTGGVYSLVYTQGFTCVDDTWCPVPLLCNETLGVCTPDGTGTGEIVEKQWYALAWGMYTDELGRSIGIDYYWQAPSFLDAAGVPQIPPGNYQFLTLIDSHDRLKEFDEANNIDAVPFTLSLLERVGTPDTWFVKTPTGTVPAKLVEIKNSWVSPTDYAVTVSTGATWLSVTPASGTLAAGASTVLTMQVDTAGLAAARYDATVTVEAVDFPGYSLEIPVSLWVYDSASGTPLITVTPSTFSVSTPVGAHPAPVTFTVSNPGTRDLAWWAWMDVEWISVAPPDGEGPAGYSETADIFVHPEGITPGTYTGYIHVFHNAPGPARTIQVQLTVTP